MNLTTISTFINYSRIQQIQHALIMNLNYSRIQRFNRLKENLKKLNFFLKKLEERFNRLKDYQIEKM
jgi:hypothetical protein